MKKPISDMTPEECSDELVFSIFENMLKKARKKHTEAMAARGALYQALEDMCIDSCLAVCIGNQNEGTLGAMIESYVKFDEGSIAQIMKEVRGAYGKTD